MAYYPELFETDAGYHKIQGCVFPEFIRPKFIEDVQQYVFDPSDIFITAYPKSGQTWLMSIIHLMQHADKLETGEEVPPLPFHFLEWAIPGGPAVLDIIDKTPPPRAIKTHLPLQLFRHQFERNPKQKVIFLMRDPKDCLVSFYKFYQCNIVFGLFNGTWDEFFKMYKENKLPYCEITQHMKEWYKYIEKRDNSLILLYEQMLKDPRGEIVRISKFLNFKLSDPQIDIITEKTEFKNMTKDSRMSFSDLPFIDYSRGKFLRKGVAGDWENYFSKDQANYIESKMGFLKDVLSNSKNTSNS